MSPVSPVGIQECYPVTTCNAKRPHAQVIVVISCVFVVVFECCGCVLVVVVVVFVCL